MEDLNTPDTRARPSAARQQQAHFELVGDALNTATLGQEVLDNFVHIFTAIKLIARIERERGSDSCVSHASTIRGLAEVGAYLASDLGNTFDGEAEGLRVAFERFRGAQ